MKGKNKFDYYGDILDVESVCCLLNKSESTVRRYITNKELNFKKIGGDWFILKSDLINHFKEA